MSLRNFDDEHDSALTAAYSDGRDGMNRSLAGSNPEWREAAYRWIEDLPEGTTFICEDVVIALRSRGLTTDNNKAIGGVVAGAKRLGHCVKTGQFLPAITSHGASKPQWVRT